MLSVIVAVVFIVPTAVLLTVVVMTAHRHLVNIHFAALHVLNRAVAEQDGYVLVQTADVRALEAACQELNPQFAIYWDALRKDIWPTSLQKRRSA